MASDENTLQQITELRDEIAAKRAEREATRRRLHMLEERAAQLGRDAPPHITTEIGDLLSKRRHLDATIAEFGRQIARLELAPTSGLVLPPGEVLPQLAPAVVDTRLQSVERAVERQGQAIERIERRLEDDDAWRTRESTERLAGQHGRRHHERMLIVLLCVITVAVLLIVVRVY